MYPSLDKLLCFRWSFSTHVNFPKITGSFATSAIITIPSTMRAGMPVLSVVNKSRVNIQPILISTMSPFSNFVRSIFPSPLMTLSWHNRVVIIHSDKGATSIWLDVRLTAEVLDYSLPSAVSCCGHMEYMARMPTAVESYLSESQVWSQLIHGTSCEHHLTGVNTTVWWHYSHLIWGSGVKDNARYKKPAP